MVRFILLLALAVMILSCRAERPAASPEESISPERIRQPTPFGISSQFASEKLIDSFLGNVPEQKVEGELVALIVPHAAYQFSGQVAAYSYKQLEGKNFDTVVLIGPCHSAYHPRVNLKGVSIYKDGYYKTPLGLVKVDGSLTNELISSYQFIVFNPEAHLREHSLDVQLPFLQRMLKSFQIIPILMGYGADKYREELSKALSRSLRGRSALLIASSDLSHFPSYEDACKVDRLTLKAIESLKIDNVMDTIGSVSKMRIRNLDCLLCGREAVLLTLATAKKLGVDKVKVLKYANSGDTAGDKSGVVGYAAIAIYEEREMEFKVLDEKAQRELLRMARASIESYVKEGKTPEFGVKEPALQDKRGVFITIYKDGDLRGCIGRHESDLPLYQTVAQMAVSAACHDFRFPPLRKEELNEIKIKVSVYLMSPTEIKSLDQFELGKHGIIIEKAGRSATYLPEVATEQGWTKEETLSSLCQKAGLSPDAWREGTKFYIYATQVFGE